MNSKLDSLKYFSLFHYKKFSKMLIFSHNEDFFLIYLLRII